MRTGRIMFLTGEVLDQPDATQNEETPAGKTLAAELRDDLEPFVEKCSPVFQRSFYGWEFTSKINNRNYLIVFQLGSDNSISISQIGLLNFFFGRKSSKDSIDQLCTLLESIARSRWKLSTVKVENAVFEFSL
jgi:hypothetical protein